MELMLLRQPQPVKRRERVLSTDELALVLPVLDKSDSLYAAGLRLILLTAARREEVGGASWADVDLDAATWRIPKTKNGRSHVVQLSRQAVDLIRKQLPADAAGRDSKPEPVSLIFPARGGGRLANWDRATKVIHEASGTSGWGRHDLRRTAATCLGEMGEPPHVVEAVLNHVSIGSQLAATYNRSRYAPECRAALQRLGNYFDGLVVKS